MTKDEYKAKAMLLGMEAFFQTDPPHLVLFRKKTGPSRFAGCALYSYYNADTMEIVVADRSELER